MKNIQCSLIAFISACFALSLNAADLLQVTMLDTNQLTAVIDGTILPLIQSYTNKVA
jgi:hypothetical protein